MKRWSAYLRLLNSPDWSFVIVTILLSIFLFLVLHTTWLRGAFDLTNWAMADGKLTEQFALKPSITKAEDKRLATRQQRIVYPLLAYVAAFGSPVFVPALLVFVNFLALCFMGLVGGYYAQSLNRHAVWGVLFSLYPGFLTVLRSDSPEILEAILLLGSLLCLRRSKHVLATVLLSVAVLTKESALLLVPVAGCIYLIQSRQATRSIKWFYFSVPLLLMTVWEGVLFKVWGTVPLRNNLHEIGLPLVGFIRLFRTAIREPIGLSLFTILVLIGLASLFVLAIAQVRDAAFQSHEKAAMLLYGCWTFSLNGYIFNTDLNFLKASSEFYLLAVMTILASKGSGLTVMGVSVILLWIYYAIQLAQKFL